MDDMRNAGHRRAKTCRVVNGAEAHFDARRIGPYKRPVAGGPKENGGRQTARAEAIKDVTADKSARSCEQDLQSGQAEFFADLAQFLQGEINLFVRVGCHQADTDQFLPWRHGG
jgi:uncharacterized membrane-anchored protein